MAGFFDSLRKFSLGSVLFRLVLAQAVGATIGYGRARKKANAGLRTYMLTCIGAALTMLISMYEYEEKVSRFLTSLTFSSVMYALRVFFSFFLKSVDR